MPQPLTAQMMRTALARLDECLDAPTTLIVGGGGAMLLAHGFSLSTLDIDAVPKGKDLLELDPSIKAVAKELRLTPDWLNPYYATFTYTLPPDYGERLIEIFAGRFLKALALSKVDLLVMKCFAHRQKDVGHAKALIRGGAEVDFVEAHIESLLEEGVPGAQEALDFLDDVREQVEP